MLGRVLKRIIKFIYLILFCELFLPCSFDIRVDERVFNTLQFSENYDSIVAYLDENFIVYVIILFVIVSEPFFAKKTEENSLRAEEISYSLLQFKSLNTYMPRQRYVLSYLKVKICSYYSSMKIWLSFNNFGFQRLTLISKRVGYLPRLLAASTKYKIKEITKKLWK